MEHNVFFRNLFQPPLNAKDSHPKSQQHFSSTKLYISPSILTLRTVFSTNQVRLPHPPFPHINITYILYLLYLNLPIPFQVLYFNAYNM